MRSKHGIYLKDPTNLSKRVGRVCGINGLLLQVSVFMRRSITRSKRNMKSVPLLSKDWIPRAIRAQHRCPNAKGYRACIQRPSREQHLSSSSFDPDTKLSVYFPAGWLKVYVVSTHVKIFIFPSIRINFLTHFTELTSPFTSASASSARSTCVNYFSRHCHHCKRAHLRQGVPTSPSQTWTQMLWSPVHDLNYCPTLLSRVLGCRYCPRLVLFHTCSLFISLYNWLRCRSKNPKIW